MDTTTPRTTGQARYSPVAVALHWLLAVLIVGNVALGVYMADLSFSMTRLKLYNWHKWAGAVILLLSALRLVWRLTHQPPAPPAMPSWQRSAAHATHLLLYALFFAVPLAGWSYSSASGFPLVVFGVLPLPDWVPVNREWADVFKLVHKFAAFGLSALVGLHVVAALKHQLVDRDGLLLRMLPGR